MSDIPRIKEDLLSQIERQSNISLSEIAKSNIQSAIRLYNEGKYIASQRKITGLHSIKSASLQELRDKITYQLNPRGGNL